MEVAMLLAVLKSRCGRALVFLAVSTPLHARHRLRDYLSGRPKKTAPYDVLLITHQRFNRSMGTGNYSSIIWHRFAFWRLVADVRHTCIY